MEQIIEQLQAQQQNIDRLTSHLVKYIGYLEHPTGDPEVNRRSQDQLVEQIKGMLAWDRTVRLFRVQSPEGDLYYVRQTDVETKSDCLSLYTLDYERGDLSLVGVLEGDKFKRYA